MTSPRNLPIFASLLLVASPAVHSFAQAPLLPAASPAAPVESTPAPALDSATPAPIAPPPVINGQPTAPTVVQPGQPALPGQPPPPAVDTAAPAGAPANAAGPRAREFQGDDVGQVLRLLARQAKINMIVSDTVLGTISMRLEDVTALQAIEVICQSKGYDLTQQNGVYYVKTAAERAAEPTEGDYYTFSYAHAKDVAALLKSQFKNKTSEPQVDERTNTVFYQEAKSNLKVIKAFLERVDRPTKQVMIEARLVEVNANPRQSYGINWGGVVGSSGSPQTFKYAGSGLASSTVVQSTNPATGQTTSTAQLGTLPTVNVDSGHLAGNDFILDGLTNGNFGSALLGQFAILSVPQLTATLRLLNEDSDSEFLANPRIVTADNLEATIKIVRNQPVPQLNFNEQTATAVFGGFQDKVFGNTLVVKPSVNKDNFITLSVKPTISSRVGDQVFNFGGANVTSPIIDTRELESNVLIKSGCTLAIGGLLQDESSKGLTKVPVLGDIPILGYLFQEHLNSRTKRNLLIFVTPTIISQQYGTGLEDQITGLKNSSNNEYADINGWRNNAKGSVKLVKRPYRQLTGEYPAPGDCNTGKTVVPFKESAAPRAD